MLEIKDITLPDIGNFDQANVIEILVNVGDMVEQEESLITLEGDKASMEIPSPVAGKITEILLNIGDTIKKDQLIAKIALVDRQADSSVLPEQKSANIPSPQNAPEKSPKPLASAASQTKSTTTNLGATMLEAGLVHASPLVRKTAREKGIDLTQIQGSGAFYRITIDDLHNSQKTIQTPLPDFSKFGSVSRQKQSRIQQLAGKHLQNCWQSIPHVTQFDQVDITSLEAFRQNMKAQSAEKGVRLTLLAFIMKASACALKHFPTFNASFDPSSSELILKAYYHIGFAVDTPAGLVVPVIRDVDQKTIYDIAGDLQQLSQQARDGKLTPADMQGGCFSISSLGGIGGTQFTPVVNSPEVAILGVSRAAQQPIWNEKTKQFEPKLMLPLALSYDHRVIDGAKGARFITYLNSLLTDIRRVLL